MRTFRTLLVVAVAFGAVVVFSSGAGAASTPSPKFCANYTKVTQQLSKLDPTTSSKGQYDGTRFKTFSKGLSNLAKSASGKLKSDLKTMASFFKSLGSVNSAPAAAKFYGTKGSALKKYTAAATDFATAGISCYTATSTVTTG